MTEQFYSYENTFLDVSEKINNICASFDNLSKEKKESALDDGNDLIKRCKNLVSF